MPISQLDHIGRACRALWIVFKVGLPLGVAILVLGAVAASLLDPQHFAQRVPARIAATAEVILALACASLALVSVLDGYAYVRGFGKSARLAISGALANGLIAALIASAAVALTVMAFRDWQRP
jgi:hypothetical protein